MNRAVWIPRATAAASVVLVAIALTSIVAIAQDLAAVNGAKVDAPTATQTVPSRPATQWKAPQPALRRNGATAEIAISEYLNGRLGQLGLNIVSVSTPTVQPLGGGLQLAEVRVQASGDASATAAVANWVAVNREAVRMKSMVLGLGPDQEGTCTLVLLLVIA